MEFKPEVMEEINKLLERYPTREAALLPVLHIAQREFGHVSPDAEAEVARVLELPQPRVHGVATFYTMYNKKPVGKYHVQICTNVACSLLGAEPLAKYLEKKLKCKVGSTSGDKKFTLNKVECLGSCGTAPAMQINDDYYENLTQEKIDEIIDGLE